MARWQVRDQQLRVDASLPNLHWSIYDLSGNRVRQGTDRSCTPTPEELAEWDRQAPEIIARWQPHMQLLQTPLYIRFGDLPRNGKSRNHATGAYERGISCYEAEPVLDASTRSYDLAGCALPGALYMGLLHGQTIYLITGNEVGTGSDGEPLLANAKILAKLTYDRESGYFVEEARNG